MTTNLHDAIATADARALADHEAGTCHQSEWSCSHCEAADVSDPERTVAGMTTTSFSYGCPTWCERTDHWADVVNPKNPPVHYSPDFGPFGWRATNGGTFELDTLEIQATTSAGGLRQIAADALAAAEWLEANR